LADSTRHFPNNPHPEQTDSVVKYYLNLQAPSRVSTMPAVSAEVAAAVLQTDPPCTTSGVSVFDVTTRLGENPPYLVPGWRTPLPGVSYVTTD
jgi:hypothetical protein